MSSDDPRAISANPTVNAQARTEVPRRDVDRRSPHSARRASDRGNNRPLPASVLTPPTPPPPPHLDDYGAIVGQSQLDTLRYLAKEFKARRSRW